MDGVALDRKLTLFSDKIRIPVSKNHYLKISLVLFILVWSWTLIDVADLTDWTMENLPVFLWVGILTLTYQKFRFSDMSYILIMIFLAMHVYGAKDIYANNSFGNWLKEVTHSQRNNYDRIVHFSFGFLISYPMLDLFTNFYKWPFIRSMIFIFISQLAFAAFYEIIEWILVTLFFPEQGINFLGIQGDEWDSQKDMFIAAVGSLCFITFQCILKRKEKIFWVTASIILVSAIYINKC
jgi:putative membrane protein